MVKNCFTCSKNEDCVDYEVCDNSSLWVSDKLEPEKQCSNCKYYNFLSGVCSKTLYYKSRCINKDYAEYEYKG